MSFNTSDLASMVKSAPSDRFTPETYLKKNGSVGCGVKVLGAYGSITPQTALLILSHPEEFKQAVMQAIKNSQREGEADRLLKAAQTKAANKSKVASQTALSPSGLTPEEAAMLANANS